MDVYTVSDLGLTEHGVEELPALLRADDHVVWVDMAARDEDLGVLTTLFGFHELAVHDCSARNHVSKVHAYRDHVFTVVHAPEPGSGGHVHFVELDQFIGPNYLVTVRGPVNPAVDAGVSQREVKAVIRRIRAGSVRPDTPMTLSAAILSAMVRREVGLVAELARESGRLEQEVTDDDRTDDPEVLLEALYEVRQQLLAIRTMAAHAGASFAHVAALGHFSPSDGRAAEDVARRFDRVRSTAEDQREFVSGVIEFFRTRTDTHMALATEQLAVTSVQQNEDMRKITAWVAIVAVPTAVTGFFGQNVPYPGFGDRSGFLASTVLIVVVAAILYLMFRRRNWL